MAINLPMFILSYCLYDSTHVHKSGSVLGKLLLERSSPIGATSASGIPVIFVVFLCALPLHVHVTKLRKWVVR